MTLEEIFANCVKKIGNNNKAIQRFVIEAKQADPTVTVGEVKDIAGFNIDDVDGDFETNEERKEAVERKQASLNQKWRNNIMEPVKSAILAKMFPDKTVADVWGREADDEAKKIREQLEDKYLPKRSRASSATTNFDHLADLF